MKPKILCALGALAMTLTACSTTPDPAKVCTAEWIAPRADRAAARIETKLERTFRAIRKAGGKYVAGEEPGPLTLLSLRSSLNDLERELKDGRGVKDLRILAQTCNDPELIRTQIVGLFERQNVPEGVIGFMERFGILDGIIETAQGLPDTVDRNG